MWHHNEMYNYFGFSSLIPVRCFTLNLTGLTRLKLIVLLYLCLLSKWKLSE